MTEQEQRAVREVEVGMRQMLMDLDGLDADRNGLLDFDEFCRLIKEREMGVHTTQMLKQRFDAIDKDGSGTIDSSEFLSFALRDSLSRSMIDVGALLKRWDTSGDGKVDRKEFRTACRTLYAVNFSDKEIDTVFDEIDYDVSSRVLGPQ